MTLVAANLADAPNNSSSDEHPQSDAEGYAGLR
jgi:hypothetical protein